MLALIPVVQNNKCMHALAPTRDVYPKAVGEMTKTMRLAQVAKTNYGDFQCEQLTYMFGDYVCCPHALACLGCRDHNRIAFWKHQR